MTFNKFAFWTVFLIFTHSNMASAKDAELEELVEQAKKISQQFSSTLKQELMQAMADGGPVNAIAVCSSKAQPITEKVAKDNHVKLSHVSLKNRNPKNEPNDWQKVILKSFEERLANGEEIQKLAYAKIVETEGQKQFRFMKAIPTQGLCLTCHGENLAPELSQKIKQLYPQDKATGYKVGEIRGAIVIQRNL